MKGTIQKISGFFLILLFCLGMLPLTAQAAPEEALYQQVEDGPWITGSFSQACEDVYDGGVIQLVQDVALSATQTISKSVTITSEDPLKPCCISAAAPNHGYLLTLEGAVTLADIILDGGSESGLSATRALVSVNAGNNTVTLSGGAVLQNNYNATQNGAGGGLCLITGTVQMNGGTIRNCSAQTGGGVAIVNSPQNRFVLNGGTITGNTAWGDSYLYGGGAVYLATGIFVMEQGTIQENSGYVGGAIFINNPTGASITMTGGSITDNEAQYGGGIYSSQIRLLALYGGTITENVAQIRGGGVFVSPIGQVQLKGAMVIDDNLCQGGSAYHNFYLEGNPSDSTFKAEVQIVGSLAGSRIGVSTIFDPALESEGKLYIIDTDGTYSITESDFGCFYSDDDAYHLLRSQDQLYLQPHSYTEYGYNADGHWKKCECGLTTTPESHVWDGGTVLQEASCDTPGRIEYRCTLCGYTRQEELAVKAHSVQYFPAVASSCTGNGNIEYWYCTVCGRYFSDGSLTTEISREDTILPAAGHQTEIRNAREPTCTEDGYTGDKFCKICGALIEKGGPYSQAGAPVSERSMFGLRLRGNFRSGVRHRSPGIRPDCGADIPPDRR